jgi:hypothetical protein
MKNARLGEQEGDNPHSCKLFSDLEVVYVERYLNIAGIFLE